MRFSHPGTHLLSKIEIFSYSSESEDILRLFSKKIWTFFTFVQPVQFRIGIDINKIILNARRIARQQHLQALTTVMALSVEAIMAIIGVLVALPSAAMIIWTLVKRRNISRLRRKDMAICFLVSSVGNAK